ncbi:hypothetical protein [Erythrobacter sp. CCH5-A1]|uniref:hypothetical protein n=1 Tax=Erythrobacter sp. CCH5-A1 TaxID=1768792 RepID=UPI00082F6F3F|nr:hypothetical protein [Erythrobacter sp. CCH5-A1]
MTAYAERQRAQNARRDALARLRLVRPLTSEERDEEARLERCLQMRVWRAQQREVERRIAAREKELTR